MENNFLIKIRNNTSAVFSAVLLDNDIIVTKVWNITEEAPFLLKLSKELKFPQQEICKITYNFIKDRSISNNRINLDNYLTARYNLRTDINNFRLFNNQYTLTILNGGISPFDEYYIVPETPFILSYLYENPKYWNLWYVEEKKYDYYTKTTKDPDFLQKYVVNPTVSKERIVGTDCIPSKDESFCIFNKENRIIYLYKDSDFITLPVEISRYWCSYDSLYEFVKICKINNIDFPIEFSQLKEADILLFNCDDNNKYIIKSSLLIQ